MYMMCAFWIVDKSSGINDWWNYLMKERDREREREREREKESERESERERGGKEGGGQKSRSFTFVEIGE